MFILYKHTYTHIIYIYLYVYIYILCVCVCIYAIYIYIVCYLESLRTCFSCAHMGPSGHVKNLYSTKDVVEFQANCSFLHIK